MSEPNERLQARLRGLREEFDAAFARPRAEPAAPGEDFLLIRVSGEPYALRLREVVALDSDRAITPVPSEAPGLLGVAGLRGALVAVFDLAQLLGHGPAAPAGPAPAVAAGSVSPRWLGLIKGSQVAVAFSEFEGQRRLGSDALATTTTSGERQELVRAGGVQRPIVQLAALEAGCTPSSPPASWQGSF